ncbi:MAG: TetR/AcrR family transcriptional regulator [Pikeienuella sp.]
MTQPAADRQQPIREEILDNAMDLFCHYGFAKTSMSDIAGRCGMSSGNLYRYFKNKRAIGIAAVERHFEAARAFIVRAQAAAPRDPESQIRAVLRAGVEHMTASMEQNPRMIELADFVTKDAEGWALLQDYFNWRRARIVKELESGCAAGLFLVPDPQAAAIALQHAVKAFNLPYALAKWRDRKTVMPELDAVLDLVFSGLRRA